MAFKRGWVIQGGISPKHWKGNTPRRLMDISGKFGIQLDIFRPADHIISPDELAKLDLPDFVVVHSPFTELARMLESAGVRAINRPDAIDRSRSKAKTASLLWSNDIPTPKTVIESCQRSDWADEKDIQAYVERLGEYLGFPIVAKDDLGCGGKGVHLYEDADEMIASGIFSSDEPRLIYQECIRESMGSDIRVGVVGGKAIGAVRRIGKDGDFRSNIHAGGHAEPLVMSYDMEELATKTADALGLEYAGIDLLETKDGLVVCEANSSPGITSLEEVGKCRMAWEIMKYIDESVY